MVAIDIDASTIATDRIVIYRQFDGGSDSGELFQVGTFNILPQVEEARKCALRRNNQNIPRENIHSLSDRSATPYIDPSTDHVKKQSEISLKHIKALRASVERLNELKIEAIAEKLPISSESEKDLLEFIERRVFTRRPFITLLDNGNLRVLWKNSEGEQIGLQFLGDKKVQYVFFAKRAKDDFIARSSGIDSLSEIDRHINIHELAMLMTA